MNTKKIDWLNMGLILLSLVVAIYFPFRLFIFAYAILGPLHYLTEINWLSERKYFVQNNNWAWVAVSFVVLMIVPRLLMEPDLGGVAKDWWGANVFLTVLRYSNGFFFLWLMLSMALVFFKDWKLQLGIGLVGLVGAYFLNFLGGYRMLFGLLLPTLIHVFLFTGLFMLYGAIKSKSWPGYIGVAMLFLVPFFVWWVEVEPRSYFFPDFVKQMFGSAKFHLTNLKFMEVLHIPREDKYYVYRIPDLKLQIFIAFAYTYHYLNWFSKTSIIQWHKSLRGPRAWIIAVVWALSLGLFWYDYKVGFYATLGLSVLHVMLEFPLNVVSVKGIVSGVFGRKVS